MNGVTFFRNEGGTLSPIWRFLSIVLSFLVLWPLVCGIVVLWMKGDLGTPLLRWAGIYFCAGFYVFLLAPAFLAGIVHAVAAVRFHYNSLSVPLAVAVGAITLALAQGVVTSPESVHNLLNVPAENLVGFLIASLTASFTCWRLTRRFARVE